MRSSNCKFEKGFDITLRIGLENKLELIGIDSTMGVYIVGGYLRANSLCIIHPQIQGRSHRGARGVKHLACREICSTPLVLVDVETR